MAGIDIQKFVGGVIGAVVCIIIVVAVGVPIIGSNLIDTTATETYTPIANADAINSMIQIVPLLLVVAIIIAIVGMFLYSRKA